MTTIGKYRHLSECSTDEGHFVVLAIDHRDNLLQSLNKHHNQPLTDAQFMDFKQAIMGHLLTSASAVLTDPAYGLGAGIVNQVISGKVGFLSPIEVTDYNLHPGNREVRFIPNWSVGKIKRMGASGVKMLLPYHPQADNVQDKHDSVQQVIDACDKYDIPFFLEPIAYSLDPANHLNNAELRDVVVEMARVFSNMGVDILKMEFPVDAKHSHDESEWQSACEALDSACTVPWALLSAGVDYETFARQARIACSAGASGVIVGRAVWAEATHLTGEDFDQFLSVTARQRMDELAEICATYAQPWHQGVDTPDVRIDWYEDYPDLE